MAEDRKSRLTYLLLGILIGLVFGVMALLVVQMNNKSANNEKVAESTIERIADKVLGLLYLKSEKEEKKPDEPTDPKVIVKEYTVVKTGKDSTSEHSAISTVKDSLEESMGSIDSMMVESLQEDDDIFVKKDELLEVRTVELTVIGTQNNKTENDTLLEETADVVIEKSKSAKTNFLVEWWKSPINYKGYKMGKNKIVLFGINPDEPLKLYCLDEEIYIKLPNMVFHLEQSNDFHSYEKVSKPSILALVK